jgi:hydroxymethylglutaryl-CoA lyase
MPIYPQYVVIEEQGLRDGLQPESALISTEKKIAIINRLITAGLKRIQVTAFVNPELVPQMADADELCRRLNHAQDVVFSALVLNEKGVRRAADAGLKHISASISASDTHNRKNANVSLTGAMHRILEMIRGAKQAGLTVRGGVQCAFGCRYEGRIKQDLVIDLVKAQLDEGIDELTLADTTGMAHPVSIRELSEKTIAISENVPVYLHLHDTEGKGLANALAGLTVGISCFETAFGGSGGCPFIRGASGNVSTEDLVLMLSQMGIQTAIDIDRLAAVSRDLEKTLGKRFEGKVHAVLSQDGIKIVR